MDQAKEQERDGSTVLGVLRRAVDIRASEFAVTLGSFMTFALVLCGYYLIRPIRENVSAEATADQRQFWFLLVFLVMLAAVPVFAWIVARLPRSAVLPALYWLFVGLMLFFWATLRGDGGATLGGAFFVFGSVFNLFVVSLFWILMSDIYDSGQAKRLYGFIAAGGTVGAIAGPFAANGLVPIVGQDNLLLMAALVFVVAAALSVGLRTVAGGVRDGTASEQPPTLRTLLSGAERVFRDPYILRIAVYILIANLLSTFFYLEQSRLAGETIRDAGARVQFFAERDLITSVLSALVQVFVTGRVMARWGVGVAASVLPVLTVVGLAVYAAWPELHVVAAIMVAERVAAFALSNPATKVLYTAVDVDERYKAQNFIDTVVYRGGDALSGAVFNGLTKALGLPLGAVALASIPVAGLWFALSRQFDRALKSRLLERGEG
ncbi:NTP/NDP exchange transporter [Hyphomicrobium sp.]|uniref:NTP/NDP exchange transporter n=1 Tax=Hyphomicrobium sp. TaxID=82 RepID=UPI002E3800A7|nr:MFS transporter [Hyphomicrobium sp.]HEX2842868.1 MFS transporter [Hyphomicrobium sp.]